eukprot:TRINITY_DN12721_c0_g1_i1.p2 TRINITY_DN12721_c0_g1~~TRINITY_DN12721_c0_g1_i1.p2  ORF type:complete len:152 (-),score=40.11 TRINITY_DN12721_c0_g1_i1:37-441(-)
MLLVVAALVAVALAAPGDKKWAEPDSPGVKAAGRHAVDLIIAAEGLEKAGLNGIVEAYRQVYDGFLYTLLLEVITKWELIRFEAKVFKDMGEHLSLNSYKEVTARWRPDKRGLLSDADKKRIHKERNRKIKDEL